MKLRDFLNTMSVDCDALITIEGYCNQVEYDFKSERESNDRLSEIIEKNKTSLVLEEWYAEIMDKEVERFSSYYDEEQKRAVIEICVCEPNPVLKEEEENRIVDDIILYLDTLEHYNEALNICEKNEISHINDLAGKYYGHYLLDGWSDEVDFAIILEDFRDNVNICQKYLFEYYAVFKDKKAFLMAECKDMDERKIIRNWLNEFGKRYRKYRKNTFGIEN